MMTDRSGGRRGDQLRTLITILIISLANASSSFIPPGIRQKCGIQTRFGRGNSWIGYLKSNGEFRCNAYIIHAQYVLTAAQCVIDQPAQSMRIEFNQLLNKNKEANAYRVDDVVLHPNYRINPRYYPAIVRLKHPIVEKKFLAPICLADKYRGDSSILYISGSMGFILEDRYYIVHAGSMQGQYTTVWAEWTYSILEHAQHTKQMEKENNVAQPRGMPYFEWMTVLWQCFAKLPVPHLMFQNGTDSTTAICSDIVAAEAIRRKLVINEERTFAATTTTTTTPESTTTITTTTTTTRKATTITIRKMSPLRQIMSGLSERNHTIEEWEMMISELNEMLSVDVDDHIPNKPTRGQEHQSANLMIIGESPSPQEPPLIRPTTPEPQRPSESAAATKVPRAANLAYGSTRPLSLVINFGGGGGGSNNGGGSINPGDRPNRGTSPGVLTRIQCREPIATEGLSWQVESGDSLLPGTVISFTCRSDMNFVGEYIALCMTTGQWNSRQPRCIPKTNAVATTTISPNAIAEEETLCRPVKSPINGRFTVLSKGNRLTEGTLIRFSCFSGFRLRGNQATICVSGQWTYPVPECIQLGCLETNLPDGELTVFQTLQSGVTQIETEYFPAGTILNAICDADYYRQGPALTGCTSTHNWTPLPLCLRCGKPAATPATNVIVGGKSAVAHSWPWMARLELLDSAQYCGGVLLNSRWVATASHCLINTNPTNYRIHLGRHNIAETREFGTEILGAVILEPEKIYQHPNWQPDGGFDIGLLKLKEEIAMTNKIRPICLPSQPYPSGRSCWTIGWGWYGNYTQAGAYPTTLQQTRIGFDNCPVTARRRDHYFCSEDNKGRGICDGDSGGPLMCLINDSWQLFGISAKTELPCGKRSFFTKVTEFQDWILKTMEK